MTDRSDKVVEVQLVVGRSREPDPSTGTYRKGWTVIPLIYTPSGWYGALETQIEGKEVYLSINVPLQQLAGGDD